MDFDPSSLVGTLVAGRYLLEEVVGEGGFSVVFRAKHVEWRRTIALKVLRPLPGLDAERRAELLASFQREAVVLAELSERSSAIVQARDVGTHRLPSGAEVPFIALEWLEGRTLEDLLEEEARSKGEPRSLEETRELLGPVAEALALAHDMGIVHRDVKPSNVFVVGARRAPQLRPNEAQRGPTTKDPSSRREAVKLLDFGIAKVLEDQDAASRAVTGLQPFTPRYGAPEQFDRRFGRTSPRTDVFAFASMFVEVLLGRPIVASDRLGDLARVALDEARRPTPASFGLLVSDDVDAVFAKALAVAPAARFESLRAFSTALDVAMRDGPMSGLTYGSSRPSAVVRASPALERRVGDALGEGTLPAGHAPRRVSEVPAASLEIPAHAGATPPTAPRRAARRTALAAAFLGVALVSLLLGRALRDREAPASTNAAGTTSAAPAHPAPSAAPSSPCPPEMALVPGGDFFMGTDDPKATADERPAHPVHLAPYCLDIHEVTAAEYKACSDKGKCKRALPENAWDGITKRQKKLYDPLCNVDALAERGTHPMNCVDWESAESFCQEARGGHLPTEAQWELAARGSDGRIYPWGDEPPAPGLVNACGLECVLWGKKNPDPDGPLAAMYKSDDGYPTTAPVGSFPRGRTVAGMEDMVGNVWEWVSDFNAPYTKGPRVADPKGPASGSERGIRGGAWNGGDASWLRPTFRFSAPPTMTSHGIGFRCAK